MKKKLFVSIPMKDRTPEDIKNSMEKMHKLAELILNEIGRASCRERV